MADPHIESAPLFIIDPNMPGAHEPDILRRQPATLRLLHSVGNLALNDVQPSTRLLIPFQTTAQLEPFAQPEALKAGQFGSIGRNFLVSAATMFHRRLDDFVTFDPATNAFVADTLIQIKKAAAEDGDTLEESQSRLLSFQLFLKCNLLWVIAQQNRPSKVMVRS